MNLLFGGWLGTPSPSLGSLGFGVSLLEAGIQEMEALDG